MTEPVNTIMLFSYNEKAYEYVVNDKNEVIEIWDLLNLVDDEELLIAAQNHWNNRHVWMMEM